MGHLTLYMGPMFSGKTTRLLCELTERVDTGSRVLFVSHLHDVRPGDRGVSSHSSQFRLLSHLIDSVRVERLENVDVKNYQVIGVDEAQFYPDLISTVIRWVDQEDKMVFCSGLDGTYQRTPFGHFLELIPYADKCKMMHSLCHYCLKIGSENRAPFTLRTTDEMTEIVIGGVDKYIPVCRHHYLEHHRK